MLVPAAKMCKQAKQLVSREISQNTRIQITLDLIVIPQTIQAANTSNIKQKQYNAETLATMNFSPATKSTAKRR